MIRFFLVRHGVTDFNAQSRMQGQTNEPLNEIGRNQAFAVGKRLSNEKISVIYTSDLHRTLETARAIAEHHELTVTPDPRLREMDFGQWEGLTYDEIQVKDPEGLDKWSADILGFAPPGGENLVDFSDRVAPFSKELIGKHHGEIVLIVAHGGSLRLLICELLAISPTMYWQFHLSPGSLSEIAVYPEGAIVNKLNDTCHLNNNFA